MPEWIVIVLVMTVAVKRLFDWELRLGSLLSFMDARPGIRAGSKAIGKLFLLLILLLKRFLTDWPANQVVIRVGIIVIIVMLMIIIYKL